MSGAHGELRLLARLLGWGPGGPAWRGQDYGAAAQERWRRGPVEGMALSGD